MPKPTKWLLAASALAGTSPALAHVQPQIQAQTGANPAPAALAEEVADLRAEVEALRAELRAMRAQTAAAVPPPVAPPPAASPPPAVAATSAVAPAKPATDPVQLGFKGAPEFKNASGWSFKPRGRLQIDGGYLAAPGSRVSGQSDGRGFTSRVRRVFIGAQGTMPGGFGYRAEADFSNNAVSWNDVYLTWDKGPINLTVGQHHPFTSLEQLNSDLYLTFNERAAFIQAFNMERRVGVSAGFHKGAILVNAGVFTDDISALGNDGNKSFSMDGRVVWMPKFDDLQLHVAGSLHHRDLGKFQGSLGVQYRARPYIATTDIRYVDTGVLTVNDETHYGTELAAVWKRFHATGEAAWLKVNRPGPADPLFFGGYAELGLFLTEDTRVYKNGQYDRVVPKRPLGGGGLGALELNLRYDRLDLTDAGIGGGVQNGYGAGLIWMPTAYVRFLLNYMHLTYDIPSQQPRFGAEVIGARAQLDF